MIDTFEPGTHHLYATPHWYRRPLRRRGRVGAALELLYEHLQDLRGVRLTEDDIIIEIAVRKGVSVRELARKVEQVVLGQLEPLDRVTVSFMTQADIGVAPIAESEPEPTFDSRAARVLASLPSPRSSSERPDVVEEACWHCGDVVLVERVHCESCPSECDLEDCDAPGCRAHSPTEPAPLVEV